MVGYDPNNTRELTGFEHGFAGAASGVLTRGICQPLDVLKIRFQLQLEPISRKLSGSKYTSILHALRTISKEERIGALWKGHVPAQFLSVTYGISQFVSFEILTHKAWKHLPNEITTEWRPTLHFFCGGISGCIATCICQPFDTIRTRLVGQGEPKVYNGIVDAVRTMCQREGPRSLYLGLTPTLIQTVPYTGLQFAFYSFFIKVWNQFETSSSSFNHHIGWTKSIICGSLAGVTSKATIYPLDLAKKRLQVQGFEEARKSFGKVGSYVGLVDCFVKIVQQEGFRGLFKGFAPSLLKAAMASGCSFCFYDQICNGLRLVDLTRKY